MLERLTRRHYLMLWQLLFLILGTSWLWAPHLNPGLSYRTSLISQYETSFQPYSLFFRAFDMASGFLLIVLALAYFKNPSKRVAGWLLLILGIGLFTDPLLATTCHMEGNTCREYFSSGFVLHAIETTVTSTTLFVIAVYDSWLRKKMVSIVFIIFQVVYGVLFLSQLANHDRFNTVSQFVYQTVLIVWLAWFGRDFLVAIGGNFKTRLSEPKIVKAAAAVWAFLNGVVAIVISLAHIHLLGRIKGLYFAGDSAWLAQHGVIIGVVMLYLSRHLARGEMRARQIFLTITGIETLKYSVISPNPSLMLLYLLTFLALFIFRDDFDRGTISITWRIRLKDLYFMVSGLLLAVLAALLALDRDSRVSLITGRTFDSFFDYVTGSDLTAHSHLRSALLAHTITAFVIASLVAILWILFRPYKAVRGSGRDYQQVRLALERYSKSSEDYFKLWPADKDYYWHNDGFVAYKPVGAIAFALADPVAIQPKRLLTNFVSWAKEKRLVTCFLPVYEQSLATYKKAGLDTIQIGSSAVVDITQFVNETSKDKWWRWQKNRAEKAGYLFAASSPPHSASFLHQLRAVSDVWLQKDGHAERGFALGYFNEKYLQQCTIYYLKDESDKVLAFTNQLPQFNPSDTLTIDLLRYLPEANNAMPYLLYKMIESHAAEDKTYRYFDLGFVPFAKAHGSLLSIARTMSAGRFSSRGLEQFKNKFNPDWRPNYMAYEGDLADLALIALNLEKAMGQT